MIRAEQFAPGQLQARNIYLWRVEQWRLHADIIPFDGSRSFQVRYRGAAGPSYLWEAASGLRWDLGGTSYPTPEDALVALLAAPIPSWLVRDELLPTENDPCPS